MLLSSHRVGSRKSRRTGHTAGDGTQQVEQADLEHETVRRTPLLSIGTSVMAAPTPNSSQTALLESRDQIGACRRADLGKEKQQVPTGVSNWLAGPDIDQRIGPVLPIALSSKATISTPPVNPGEKG